MEQKKISPQEIFDIAQKYFKGGHFHVEIWNCGLKFVWEAFIDGEEKKYTAFYQCENIDEISGPMLRGFLDSEIQSFKKEDI